MKRLLIACVALAGCVNQTAPTGGGATTPDRAQASAKVHTELAALYYENAQYAIALEEIETAMKAVRRYAPALTMRALVHMALREDKEAESDFQLSLKFDPSSSETHNNYGWFLCQRGREKESLAEFTEALKNPLYATPEKALVNAAICSRKSGNDAAAEDYYRRTLIVRPGALDAHLGLAELSLDHGDAIGAKSHYLQYEKMANELPSAANLWLAVRIERRLGNAAGAESYGAQLRKRYPEARETQLMLYGQ